MTDHTTAPATARDENRLIAERRAKLAKLRETGVAYPDFVPDARAAALHDKYDGQEQEALAANPVTVRVAGRMMLKRVMGKASFATLDSSGRIQIYLERGALGEDVYAAFKQWDIGDIIAIEGSVFRPTRASCRCMPPPRACCPSRCVRCRTSSTAWPTRNCATASATSTSS